MLYTVCYVATCILGTRKRRAPESGVCAQSGGSPCVNEYKSTNLLPLRLLHLSLSLSLFTLLHSLPHPLIILSCIVDLLNITIVKTARYNG
jgi:hypothetical protein